MTEKGNLPFQIPEDKVAAYLELKANNTDGYGTMIMNAAELWGANMENELAQGASLEAAALSTERQSLRGDFSGSMYGFVISVLSEFWERGEDFRNWYEHRYDYLREDYENSDEIEDPAPTMQM